MQDYTRGISFPFTCPPFINVGIAGGSWFPAFFSLGLLLAVELPYLPVMGRTPDVAPVGFFTLGDTARITGVDLNTVAYWCKARGAGLVTPRVNPSKKGATKLLSERDLVKVAVIPKLLEAGLDHGQIGDMFKKIEPKSWDLSEAKKRDPNWLQWVIVFRDWHYRPTWRVLHSTYRSGPSGPTHPRAMELLKEQLDGFLFHKGGMRGFQVIELSNIKRELLERLG
jgi:hypothetical protein